MSEPLFQNLKKIGVEEAIAYQVSDAMNPERYATRTDLIEAMAAHREETAKSIAAHREETTKNIAAHREDMVNAVARVRAEANAISRQLMFYFGTSMAALVGILIRLWL